MIVHLELVLDADLVARFNVEAPTRRAALDYLDGAYDDPWPGCRIVELSDEQLQLVPSYGPTFDVRVGDPIPELPTWRVSSPSTFHLIALAEVLKVEPGDLLMDGEEPPPPR